VRYVIVFQADVYFRYSIKRIVAWMQLKSDPHTMILVVAATQFEMDGFLDVCKDVRVKHIVTGVGPVESCLCLTRYLEQQRQSITCVVNFGVGGVYSGVDKRGNSLLKICLAETEIFGDLGICFPLRFEQLPENLLLHKSFLLDPQLLRRSVNTLRDKCIEFTTGNFVTVSSVSGTQLRGDILQQEYDGLCENMEGAAIARVCHEFSLPLLEIRCISNRVEDRDLSRWKLAEAVKKAGETAAIIVGELGKYEKA